jgi:hypothetical protein
VPVPVVVAVTVTELPIATAVTGEPEVLNPAVIALASDVSEETPLKDAVDVKVPTVTDNDPVSGTVLHLPGIGLPPPTGMIAGPQTITLPSEPEIEKVLDPG